MTYIKKATAIIFLFLVGYYIGQVGGKKYFHNILMENGQSELASKKPTKPSPFFGDDFDHADYNYPDFKIKFEEKELYKK